MKPFSIVKGKVIVESFVKLNAILESMEIDNLLIKHSEALKTIVELHEIIKKLEKRNADLIDLSSAAIKYHKEHKDEEIKAEETK